MWVEGWQCELKVELTLAKLPIRPLINMSHGVMERLLSRPTLVAAVGPGRSVGPPWGLMVPCSAAGPAGGCVVPVLNLFRILPLLLLLNLGLLYGNDLSLLPGTSNLLFTLLLLFVGLVLAGELGGMLLLRSEVPDVATRHFDVGTGGRLLGFSLLLVGGARGARLKERVSGKLILNAGTNDEVCLQGTRGHDGGDWLWRRGVGGQDVF